MSLTKPGLGTLRPTASAHVERVIRATPEAIFTLLSEPQRLSDILPRVTRVEVLSRGEASARVRTHMAIGPLGTIASEGEVYWSSGSELLFRSEKPVGVESHWQLIPTAQGTRVSVDMQLDLAPMMGGLTAFIPAGSVSSMLAPDLEKALQAIAKRVER